MGGAAGPVAWTAPGCATAQGIAAGPGDTIDGKGAAGPGDWATIGDTAGPGATATPEASVVLGASTTLGAPITSGAPAAVGAPTTLGGGVTAQAAEVMPTDSLLALVPAPFTSWTLLSAPFRTLGLGAAGATSSATAVASLDASSWALFIVSILTGVGGLNPGPRSIVNPALNPVLALVPVPTEARFLGLVSLFFFWSFPLVYL